MARYTRFPISRLFSFLALLLIIGCKTYGPDFSSYSSETKTINEETSEITRQKQSPIPISTSTLTPTPLPTQTPVPSSTHTRTPKPSPTLTWTPLPTLTEQESRSFLKILYEPNEDCQFPCWWGITPGETDWATTKQFLGQFSTIKEGPKKYFYKEAGKQQYSMTATFEYKNGTGEGWGRFGILNGIITESIIGPEKGTYPLIRILKEYGQPMDIYIRTFQDTPLGFIPFILLLYYPDIDTVILYETKALKPNDFEIRGCMNDVDPILRFNPLFDKMTFSKMIETIFGSDPHFPKKLFEATGLSESDFFKISLSHNEICLDTPSELWP